MSYGVYWFVIRLVHFYNSTLEVIYSMAWPGWPIDEVGGMKEPR